MKPLRYFFILVTLASVSSIVNARWEKIYEGNSMTPDRYIEMESVKQSGPMSIYRQVKVLSQEPTLDAKSVTSKVELFEYDCMNSKLRVLQGTEYSMAWATGEALDTLEKTSVEGGWQDLPKNSLGQQTFNILCPSGKDD